jgi:hypothetical protein
MDKKLEEANQRDAERARILLDEHVYVEDVDESVVNVPTDGAAKRLLKAYERSTGNGKIDSSDSVIPYPETNSEGEKRPRWKYVAQVVNTRAQRKKGRTLTSYVNNRMDNTLVEEDGTLRVATVAEAKQVAWKPTKRRSVTSKGRRNIVPQMEAVYEGAKKAWLARELQGKVDIWGKAPDTVPDTPAAANPSDTPTASTNEDDDDAKSKSDTDVDEDGSIDDESSSSDSGSDSDGSSSDYESDGDDPKKKE